jgi:aminopeptidase
MRDPRLDRLADNLLGYSLELTPGEKVGIDGEIGARDLMVALIEAAYRRGAVPFVEIGDPQLRRAWLLGATREQLDLRASWEFKKFNDLDASVYILAGDNASELADVSLRRPRPRPPVCLRKRSRISVWTSQVWTTRVWTVPWTPWST